MDLFLALSRLPTWLDALLLLGLATALAAAGPHLVRRRVGFERLVVNNEVAGFQYAVLGTCYAVLLALALLAVWEEFREAERSVEGEAAAWVVLHQLAAGVPEPGRGAVRAALQDYARAAVEQEWPAMARRTGSPAADAALRRVRAALLAVEVGDARAAAVYGQMLDRLAELAEDRRRRLDMAGGALPPLVGTVLVAGAALTVGFTLFFAGKNLWSQALMTAALCLMVMLVLFAAVELNYPFAGGVRVGPEPLERALRQETSGPG
jgi:hypothetical protein